MPFLIGTPTYGTQATDYIDALQKLLAFIDTNNNYVATMAVNAGGTGWSVGDYFDINGGTPEQSLQAVGRVTAEAAGVVTGVEIASMGAYSANPAATGATTTAVLPSTGTGLTVDLTFDSLGWTVELDQLIGGGPERESFVQGVGLDDLQAIFFGIRTQRDTPSDVHNWEIVGATGYNNALAWDNQPGQDVPPNLAGFPSCDVPLINSTMPYWFYCNKQRITGVLRPSTSYEHFYAGFGLPFGPLNLYPYPLVWSGMARGFSRATSGVRFSDLTNGHSNILDPASAGAYFRWVDGNNFATPKVFPHENRWVNLGTDEESFAQNIWMPSSDVEWCSMLRDNGGEYPLFPVVLWDETTLDSYAPQLDRVYFCPGFSLTAEDEVTVAGTKYRVFQNAFRNGVEWFLAYEEV